MVPPVQGSKWYEELYKNSVDVAGPEIKKLCLAAKDNDIHIVMGINERGSSGRVDWRGFGSRGTGCSTSHSGGNLGRSRRAGCLGHTLDVGLF